MTRVHKSSWQTMASTERWRLYTAYAFSAWNDRQWEFASVIFLIDLFGGSLLFAGVLGLCETAVGILMGPRIGAFIDKSDRLQAMRGLLLGQNISIATGALVLALALHTSAVNKWAAWSYLVLAAMAVKCCSTGIKLSFHKDWLVVMSGRAPEALTEFNTGMRRIDLVCAIVAPMVIGIIASASSSAIATFVLGVWTSLSLFVEYHLCSWLYHSVPALQSKTPKQSKSKETSKAVAVQPAAKSEINAIAMESRVAVEQSRVELVMAEDGSVAAVADPIAPIVTSVIEPQSTTSTESTAIEVDSSEPQSAVSEFFLSWHRYSQHPSFLASVAYALLYINVMNFGGIMSSFLKVRLHLTDATIATVRGVGAAVGIGSTLLVPGMISRLGLSRAAFVSIWAQCLCLVLVVLGFVLANSTTISSTSAPVILMLAGLCASRFGLWAFDITQSQIMQETVDSAEAGAINGTQESLVNVAYLGSFLLAVIWPDPHSFTWPTTISFAAVLAASFIYSLYFFRQPKSTWNLT